MARSTTTPILEPEAALSPTAPQALAAPLPVRDTRGKEALDDRDIYPSRLTLAQSTSPQTKKRDEAYLEGLEEGQFFNTITGEIYGTGPITFAVVGIAKRAGVFDEAGKMTERLAWDDPRCESPGEDASGKWIKPEGTRIYDYLLVRVEDGLPVASDVMALSCKKVAFKAAKNLNSLIHKAPGATWETLYTVTAVPAKSSDGKFNFYAPKFAYLSNTGAKRKAGPEVQAFCEGLYDALQKGRVQEPEDVIEADTKDDQDVPF
jgi:hypothetical protein